jgi:ABC-type glycerol-3-phosphate transport system permease component
MLMQWAFRFGVVTTDCARFISISQSVRYSAFYIFLLRQFFLTLPRELFEAARVDGANYWQMFSRIALPLVSTALIVVFIFEFKASAILSRGLPPRGSRARKGQFRHAFPRLLR